MNHRFEVMSFPESFEGETVIDIGCSNGTGIADMKERNTNNCDYVGYEISKNKMFKMDNGKYRSFVLLEYPVANLYKAFINRLENNKAMQKHLQDIKDTETYKELEAYVVEFTGA